MKKSLFLAALVAAVVSVIVDPMRVGANHEPADKASAAASDIEHVDDAEPVLRQTMRVSSTSDLILQTTAECSILTSLFTEGSPEAGSTESDGAFGQVEMWITIDGKPVPVATDDAGHDGEVVFCNRAYQRTVSDREDEQDGHDGEDDFIRTRNANGFNWMAFDVGKEYDSPANGNNIVEIVLHARYTREPAACASRPADNVLAPYGQTCADAFVGSRTLIVEAVQASNHEQTDNGAE